MLEIIWENFKKKKGEAVFDLPNFSSSSVSTPFLSSAVEKPREIEKPKKQGVNTVFV